MHMYIKKQKIIDCDLKNILISLEVLLNRHKLQPWSNLGLGLGLGLGLLGHSITRINILSLPFKGVDIKLGLSISTFNTIPAKSSLHWF